MKAYTPTPWHIETNGAFNWVANAKNTNVLSDYNGIQEMNDNFKHIIKCVNMHDELVEALKKCQHYILTRKQFRIKNSDDFSIANVITTTLSKIKD